MVSSMGRRARLSSTVLAAAILTAALSATALPALAADLPGSGKTIRFVQDDSLGGNYVEDQILVTALKKLGYDVNVTVMNGTLFFQAASQGDVDMSSAVTLPQREPGYEKVKDTLAVVGTGGIRGGGINGYLIDKKTADANAITHFDQLKDPKIAALFGTDGKAELTGCDPGWSCADVIEHQVKAFGLSDTVHIVRGKYEALMGETVARVQRGEPALYYTWSPSWVNDALVPGKDVVWLPTPFDSLPEGMPPIKSALVPGVIGCAGGQDPCRMALGEWNYNTVVNRSFLAANPAVKTLIEAASWPRETWVAWEGSINKDGSSNRNIKKLADDWIAANQAEFDGWIAQAMAGQ
jgi:glycine betaine/proline transport system substrate-binding protein